MKKTIWKTGCVVIICLVIFGVMSCESGTPPQSSAKRVAEPQRNTIRRIDIAMDQVPSDSAVALTRNFYFIFDGSGSMADPLDRDCIGGKSFKTKLEGAKWAVQEFLAKVPNDINLGLYAFDAKGRREIVQLGSNNQGRFIEAIKNITAGGKTPLAEAIMYGTDQLITQYKRQFGYGEFRLIVVTDGIADRIPDAAIYATERGIPIYAIGLCIKEKHPLREWAFSYRAADNFDDLAKSLEETLSELPDFDVKEFPQ